MHIKLQRDNCIYLVYAKEKIIEFKFHNVNAIEILDTVYI